MAKKRTREASISLCVKRGNGGNADVVERHGELGVGDEGRNLEREHVQGVHAQLRQREVHALAELLRTVRLAAALMRVDLEKREREVIGETLELRTKALRGRESAVRRPWSIPWGWM